MSTRATGSRAEPVRTRKSSKSENKQSGMGDIKTAFKMAVDKKSEKSTNAAQNNMETQSKLENNNSQSSPLKVKEKTTLDTVKERGEKGTIQTENAAQVTPIDLENAHDEAALTNKSIGVSIDSSKEEILDALRELSEKFTRLDDTINDSKKGLVAQVLSLRLRGDNLHTEVHGDGVEDGMLDKIIKIQSDMAQMQQAATMMEQKQNTIALMLAENKRLAQDLVTTQGLLQKYNQKIQALESKVLDLTRRGMEQNLLFHAIEEVNDEDCFYTIQSFVKEHLDFDINEEDVWKAYRMGVQRPNRSRPIFAKLSYYAKDRIMESVGALKGKKNQHGQTLFVSEQIPEGITEQRKALYKSSKALKKVEDKKPKEQQRPVKIMGDKVIIGGQVYKPEVQTPQPLDLFPSADQQLKINNVAKQIKEAEPIYSYNSTFVGLAVKVRDVQDVNLAYKAVMQRFPYMDHVMMAYQVQTGVADNIQIKFGSCDDNEHGGGSTLCKYLYEHKVDNVAVFVVRRYGGIHLGFDRFSMIEKSATKAIKLLHLTENTPPTHARH